MFGDSNADDKENDNKVDEEVDEDVDRPADELFPMKPWFKYRCLGPLQISRLHEHMLKQELFDNKDKFMRIRTDIERQWQQEAMEEMQDMMRERDRAQSYRSFRGASQSRRGTSMYSAANLQLADLSNSEAQPNAPRGQRKENIDGRRRAGQVFLGDGGNLDEGLQSENVDLNSTGHFVPDHDGSSPQNMSSPRRSRMIFKNMRQPQSSP